MKGLSIQGALFVLASIFQLVAAVVLDVNSTSSIKNASSTLAYSLMTFYTNNQSTTPADQVGTIAVPPLYWWESGAVWGGMVDYWAYTNDSTYVSTTSQALLAQVGPDNNYMPPAFFYSLGNDDQVFWAISVLNAAEYGFPSPPENSTTVWLDLAVAVFNTQIARWDTSTCGGGLRWQIFEANKGYNYKNSISNGGLFQLSARLARITGNQTYIDWTTKTWDWMRSVNLIDDEYFVYDGTQDTDNCSGVVRTPWSYNPSILLLGSATMYNYTNGSKLWEDRTTGLLTNLANNFFTPFPNATNIMYERQCEPTLSCNYDQLSFKAYLARWLAQTSILAPYTLSTITQLLVLSAQAAAQSCVGGALGTECGMRWYVDGFEGPVPGVPSVGQGLSALETVQALLLVKGEAVRSVPMTGGNVTVRRGSPTSTLMIDSRPSGADGSPMVSSSAAGADFRNRGGLEGGPVWVVMVALGWMLPLV